MGLLCRCGRLEIAGGGCGPSDLFSCNHSSSPPMSALRFRRPEQMEAGPMTRGLLTTDDLAGLVDTGKIDTVVVAFTDHYGRLHGKRFEGAYFLADIASAGTH